MEAQRGRSPSAAGRRASAHIRNTASHSASPHPQPYPHPQLSNNSSFQGYDDSFSNSSAQFAPSLYAPDFDPGASFSINPNDPLFNYNPQPQQQQLDFAHNSFLQAQDSSSGLGFSQQSSSQQLLPSLGAQGSLLQAENNNSSSFPDFDYNPDQLLEPSLLFDPQLLAAQPLQQQTLDPMATMQHQTPTPPHLLHHSSHSPSPHHSPNFHAVSLHQTTRSRNASESLDPSSAAFPQAYGSDWTAGAAFRSHRRAPSDTLSEISSYSPHPSPYLDNADSFDVLDDPSGMPLGSQQDPTLFPDALGMTSFSLNDRQAQQHYISPAHSPHISPRLNPQQLLPQFTPDNNFGLSPAFTNGYDAFPQLNPEPFPSLTSHPEGQADQMSPPEINIDFAPPSRQPSFEPPKPFPDDALSPPERNRSRNRMRAKSDSHAPSRRSTPSLNGRGRSPSLQPLPDTLSPFNAALPASRSSSPASQSSGGAGMHSRRSSTSSMSQPSHLLNDVIERRPSVSGAMSSTDPKTRVQKHPATFQCTLCPKRFTRAYNLRSHLRTHTDERPFVCTVCGKAFARQHDRKRHEGLHSGEKKFVCKGVLKSSSKPWGCGRRFARADALGRHFRSEAGRVCIGPLLDEEAAERQKRWGEEQLLQRNVLLDPSSGFAQSAGLGLDPTMMQTGGDPILPAALLQLYPDLASLDWSTVGQGGGAGSGQDMPDYPADEFSGSEFDYGMSENEMGGSGFEGLGVQSQSGAAQQGLGLGAGWNGAGGYLSDFEGR